MSLDTAGSWNRLIPMIRAALAQRLKKEGFKVGEIATVLNTTPAAVVQYLKGKRGVPSVEEGRFRPVVDALGDKLLRRVRAGGGAPMRTMELMEAADQIRAAMVGEMILEGKRAPESGEKKREEVLNILQKRLQLELRASEQCLQFAARLDDEYTKLLLRMIASDSMKHADVVSQIISWVELPQGPQVNLPRADFLGALSRIEDEAEESSLRDSVQISHPVARLLLEWIDADEKKHERVLGKLARSLGRAR